MKHRAPRQMEVGIANPGLGLGVANPDSVRPSEQAGEHGSRAGSGANAWAPSARGTHWRLHSALSTHFWSFSSGRKTRGYVMMYESTHPGWFPLALPVSIFPGQSHFAMTTLSRSPAPLHLLSCSSMCLAAAQTHSPGCPPGLLHFTASLKPLAYPKAVSSCF